MYANIKRSLKVVLASGASVGLVAGICMGLAAMIRSAAVGLGFWLPMKLIAATFQGVPALIGGGGTVLLGIFIHLVVAAAWGVVFVVLLGPRRSLAAPLLWGPLYGATVWFVMVYVVMPAVNQTMLERVEVTFTWFFVYHLIYGVVLGLAPLLTARLTTAWLGEPSGRPGRPVPARG